MSKRTKATQTSVQIIKLKMVRDEKSIHFPKNKIKTPEDAVFILKKFLNAYDREVFCIMTLDTKNQPNAVHIVSCGTLNNTIVHPRETFKLAILSNAASIIACHNHPSGDPSPSSEDIDVTKRLCDAGVILGIELLDHIILGDNNYVSLKAKGLM
ncbi:JAB domain-containing protein [Paenibacillus sp. 2KB_22]|uniref:JAB domain-containing protein n=1 Tax=Paenibacillus sp. 2KB_22 TaxID=3232978 RepID=UPI003F99B72B